MQQSFERWIGLFGDLTHDANALQPTDERLQQIIQQIVHADQNGIDIVALGEHHRPDYAIASPEIVLAAAASVTNHITLASGVSIISSTDPVKLYQDFATIDNLSGGRAEIIAGRGSFTESFPLFGYNLEDYQTLFTEKLDLLQQIMEKENLTRSWRHRAPLYEQTVYPRAMREGTIPLWIAVGGTPASVIRAATLWLPIIFAIIGWGREQFVPLVELYQTTYNNHGHDPAHMQIGVHAHTFIMESEQKILDTYYPRYAGQMDRVGASRWWSPYTQVQFQWWMRPSGSLCMGTPAQVTAKIQSMIDTLHLTRFVAHIDVGWPDHDDIIQTINLYTEQVIPHIRLP